MIRRNEREEIALQRKVNKFIHELNEARKAKHKKVPLSSPKGRHNFEWQTTPGKRKISKILQPKYNEKGAIVQWVEEGKLQEKLIPYGNILSKVVGKILPKNKPQEPLEDEGRGIV